MSGPECPPSRLEQQRIDVWAARLDPPPEVVAHLRPLLSADEIERAERFRFDHHRRRFIVARGVLRSMLGLYLDRPPASLAFEYGPKGKPSLAAGFDPHLRFNVSHSDELGLYALGLDTELGVDVEKRRPMPDAEQIAERFFSWNERLDLRGVPGEAKADAFFNCWTRKEAYIKATGDGLSMPLDRFDVSLLPGEPARMRSAEGDPAKAAEWTLLHLEPAEGYVGALCIHGHDWRVASRDWTF